MYNPSTEQGKDACKGWTILHNAADFLITIGSWKFGGDERKNSEASALYVDNFSQNDEIVNVATELMMNIENAVVRSSINNTPLEIHGSNHARFHGLTVFLPNSTWWTLKDINGHYYKEKFRDIYVNLDFSVSTRWDDLIKALYPEWNGW